MITTIEPERGGESQGILRVELSMPLSTGELRSLRDWLESWGWSIEVEQIDRYFNGEEWDG